MMYLMYGFLYRINMSNFLELQKLKKLTTIEIGNA